MHIEIMTPPRPKAYRPKSGYRSYAEMVARLTAEPGVWLRLDPKDLAGSTWRGMQNSVNQAARRRGVFIQTTVQDGSIYVRSEPAAQEVGA